MKMLTAERWQAAKAWLYAHGRPLDQRLYEYMFEQGPATAVLAALADYQNPDGGFGKALEPDIQTAASSVIATTLAFDMLRRLGVGQDEPMVQRGIGYYLATYDAAGQCWPIVPPAVEDAPHAPWWRYADLARTFSDFRLNPTAAVVGHLYDYPELAPEALRGTAWAAVSARMAEQPDPVDMNDLFCLISLSEARGLSDAQRSAVVARVQRAIPVTVVQEPARWGQYGMTPLEVAPAPAARFAPCVDRQAVETQLDWWIESQHAAGPWPLTWSWAQVDANAWAEAEQAWQGHFIVERLATLAAYGRVAG